MANSNIARPDPFEAQDYELGRRIMAQLMNLNTERPAVTNRWATFIQREARMVNGELYVTEREFTVNEDEIGPNFPGIVGKPTDAPVSWISKIFGNMF